MNNRNTMAGVFRSPAARLLVCGLLLAAAAFSADWSESGEQQAGPSVAPTLLTRPGKTAPAETAPQAGDDQAEATTRAAATAEAAATEPAPPEGTNSQATPAEPEQFIEVRALLAAAKETVLASRIQGTITSIAVTHGASFDKDKVLVSFDRGEQAARLAMAEAELAAARETHQAKLRMQGLQQASEVEVALAASAVSKAQAQIGLYRAQIEQCTIKAPFKGRVVKLEARPFQTVQPGQPLLEIVASGPLIVRLNAPAAWLPWLKRGTPFWFRIDETDKRYKAQVIALNGRVDAVSQTMEVEGELMAEKSALLPGMSGTALFTQPAR